MTRRLHGAALALLAACLVPVVVPAPVLAQGTIPLAAQAEGARIEEVSVRLRASGGNRVRDEALLSAIRRLIGPLEGSDFNRLALEARLAQLRTRMGPGQIDYSLASAGAQGLALDVVLDTSAVADRKPSFPVLHRDERSQVSLLLSGGNGFYSDTHPWFGKPATFNQFSPVAGKLPGWRTSWAEAHVETGLSAIAQIGDRPVWAYGAFTYMTTLSRGQDTFRADARTWGDLEKAYVGLLYVDPEGDRSFNLSVGRQNFTLNDGFLVHMVRGSSNAAERGATYLGPRLATDFSALADARVGAWRAKAFYLDPNELERLESRTSHLGVNLGHDVTPDLAVDATAMVIAKSSSKYANPYGLELRKEGTVTVAGHARQRHAFGLRGLWFEGEAAHQSHPDFDMSAYAFYGLAGYRLTNAPWMPSLSYRYAVFSGDDPATQRYERFDALMSTGLGIWLQGISFGKLFSNSNLETHRLQFNVTPQRGLDVTFDWHLLRAPESENRGANPALQPLAASYIGQEFTLTARWAINRQLYLQTIASHALPGRALRSLGADRPWTTLQASLYWGL